MGRVLDDELTRLPDHLRGPVVACLLQGRTQEQAAADLRTSQRTVRRRLEEARRLLRSRLERRGVVPVVAAGLVAGAGQVPAAVPAELAKRTVAVVFDFLAGGSAFASPVAVLAKGVVMSARASQVKTMMVAFAIGISGLGLSFGMAAGDGDNKSVGPRSPEQLGSASLIVPVKLNEPGKSKPAPPQAAHAPGTDLTWSFHRNSSPSSRAIANEVGAVRARIASRWLRAELPSEAKLPFDVREVWEGRPIEPPLAQCIPILYRRETSVKYRSSTDLEFTNGRLSRAWVNVSGPLEVVLEKDLGQEIFRVVMAGQFGKPFPCWAADGAAMSDMSLEAQAVSDRACREIVEKGAAARLSAIFKMTEYPKGQENLDAQAYSVARYLLGRKVMVKVPILADLPHLGKLYQNSIQPEVAFVMFAELGAKNGWDKAANDVYGFENVDALETAWKGWRKTPESQPEPNILYPQPVKPKALPPKPEARPPAGPAAEDTPGSAPVKR
ncbi:hypothetical protein [Fimbriiglobus ruber]|uniref:High-affnity carbon uptake protein Hat/HatR n=1 Tax=Fimbriiglobus ruber TaxID=1908690 RepID=A0A225DJT6_9BACT|nr:hypothetical protein [Fimbriiglobus ruber]OWK37449.1 High-affnity carbon uptake protein Hat/HatR [Fimbriiglobus ruber]